MTNAKVLTKEEIRAALHQRLDVAVDRMYEEGFVLDLHEQDAFEFATLSLEAHKKYEDLNRHSFIKEVVVLSGDPESEAKMYAEFDTRQEVKYQFNHKAGVATTTVTDQKYYIEDGTEETPAAGALHQTVQLRNQRQELSDWFELMVLSQKEAFNSSLEDDKDSPDDVKAIKKDYDAWVKLLPTMCACLGVDYNKIVTAAGVSDELE